MSGHTFISHASADDAFVKRLREVLERAKLPVWADSRVLTGGDKLSKKIDDGIKQARQVLVVLSPSTVNSGWVRTEVQLALKVRKRRVKDGYKVIPILLPGIEPSALGLWFDKEPVGIKVTVGPGGIEQALPSLFAALGEQLPDDLQPPEVRSRARGRPHPRTHRPQVREPQPGARAAARAVSCSTRRRPAIPRSAAARSGSSPPGRHRGRRAGLVHRTLPQVAARRGGHKPCPQGRAKPRSLGPQLFDAALGEKQEGRNAYDAWRHAPAGTERCFSVLVDDNMLAEASDDQSSRPAAPQRHCSPCPGS